MLASTSAKRCIFVSAIFWGSGCTCAPHHTCSPPAEAPAECPAHPPVAQQAILGAIDWWWWAWPPLGLSCSCWRQACSTLPRNQPPLPAMTRSGWNAGWRGAWLAPTPWHTLPRTYPLMAHHTLHVMHMLGVFALGCGREVGLAGAWSGEGAIPCSSARVSLIFCGPCQCHPVTSARSTTRTPRSPPRPCTHPACMICAAVGGCIFIIGCP